MGTRFKRRSVTPGTIHLFGEDWDWALSEGTEFDAQEAKHDLAHEKFYVRIVRTADREWSCYVRDGRKTGLSCCKDKKRTYVSEQPHGGYKPHMRSRLGFGTIDKTSGDIIPIHRPRKTMKRRKAATA